MIESMGAAPDVLTVMQAAGVLQIGRTTAYAMAQEWRATGGAAGMKVVEVRGQLRVPRVWLEELLGAPIEFIPDPPPASDTKKPPSPKGNDESPASEDPKFPDAENNEKKRRAA